MRDEPTAARFEPVTVGAVGAALLASPPSAVDAGVEGGTGVLLLPAVWPPEDGLLERALQLASEGVFVLALEVSEASDRAALVCLEQAASWLTDHASLGSRSLAVVGHGRGGTLAFLAGCTSTRLGAVVDLDGRVLYRELDADHPIQPIELLLNLDLPLLAIFRTDGDPDERSGVELLRSRLEDASKDAEVVCLVDEAECETAWEEAAWQRTLRFLRERL